MDPNTVTAVGWLLLALGAGVAGGVLGAALTLRRPG